jgi:dihydrofolate reductase
VVLLVDGLVDELHLFMFPLVHGAGKRLFADNRPAIKLALAGSLGHHLSREHR